MKCIQEIHFQLVSTIKITFATILVGLLGVTGGIFGTVMLLWLLPYWLGWSESTLKSDASIGVIFGASVSLISGLVVIIVARSNIEYQKNRERLENDRNRSYALSDLPLALNELVLICESISHKILGIDSTTDENSFELSSISNNAIQAAIKHSEFEDREEFRKILYYYRIVKLHFSKCMKERENEQKRLGILASGYKLTENEIDLIKLTLSFQAISWCYIKPAIQGKIKFNKEEVQEKYIEYSKDINKIAPITKMREIEFNYDFQREDVDAGFLDAKYLEKNLGKY